MAPKLCARGTNEGDGVLQQKAEELMAQIRALNRNFRSSWRKSGCSLSAGGEFHSLFICPKFFLDFWMDSLHFSSSDPCTFLDFVFVLLWQLQYLGIKVRLYAIILATFSQLFRAFP